jgi:hypothetical protein
MIAIVFLFIRMLCDCFKPRARLEAEILVLRHQLNVLGQRAPNRPHLRWVDRVLFIWRCPRILDAITMVRPETVVCSYPTSARASDICSRPRANFFKAVIVSIKEMSPDSIPPRNALNDPSHVPGHV